MFEIYRHEFELNGVKYSLIPVSGEHLGIFYSLLSKIRSSGATGIDFDEDSTNKLHKFTLEIFKKSYPEQPVDKLEAFVSQNLLKLLEHVVKVSIKD